MGQILELLSVLVLSFSSSVKSEGLLLLYYSFQVWVLVSAVGSLRMPPPLSIPQ